MSHSTINDVSLETPRLLSAQRDYSVTSSQLPDFLEDSVSVDIWKKISVFDTRKKELVDSGSKPENIRVRLVPGQGLVPFDITK